MQVEKVQISSLSYDPANARKHSQKNLAAIKGSLAKFGQQKPIVIDKNNIVIAGNGTLAAAVSLGWDTIEVVKTELSGPDAIAFALADNRTAELAEWDLEPLTKTLQSLKDIDFDLGSIGFDEDFMEAHKPEVANPGLADPDEVPKNVETRCKPGDLWILGNHRLLCGDSTNVQHVDRLMNSDKAELCFTSPPYNLGSSVGLRNGAFKGKKNAYLNHDDSIDNNDYQELLSDFLSVAIQFSDVQAVNLQMLAGNKVSIIKWLEFFKKNFLDVLIWVKTNPPPATAERVVNSAFEFIFLFSKDEWPKRAIPSAQFNRGTFSNVFITSVGSNRHTQGTHGATFTVEFAEHYLNNLSHTESIVYEPFCGSGSTLIACEKTNRKCYGMEIDPHYCDVILKRWEDFTGNKATLKSE